MKNRALLVSCTVILLCACVVAGVSYALFTDSVNVGNHLQAGNLDVTLKRTNLEYCVLNNDGELEVKTVEEDLDLTTSSVQNVFGIDSNGIRIVPGSYFDADLQIANNGNTAFTYSVQIKLSGDATKLAEQLKVTVTHPNGSTPRTTEKMLSELTGNGLSIATGEMKAGDAAQSFKVRVEFVNAADSVNNLAQNKTAAFDLVVTATQATTASTN